MVTTYMNDAEREKSQREQRTAARAAHSKELAQWQENNAASVARNKAKQEAHKGVIAAWEAEWKTAKDEKRKPK